MEDGAPITDLLVTADDYDVNASASANSHSDPITGNSNMTQDNQAGEERVQTNNVMGADIENMLETESMTRRSAAQGLLAVNSPSSDAATAGTTKANTIDQDNGDITHKKKRLVTLNQRQLIEAYQPVIVELLTPSQLLEEMGDLFSERHIRQQMLNIERRESTSKAASYFLDYLLEKQIPGWYCRLIDALKEKNYEYLVKCLESKDTEMEQEVFRKVMLKCLSTLQKLDPVQVLPSLEQEKCIVREEAEEIRKTAQRESTLYANFILLDAVVSHIENWFPTFISTLAEFGFDNIAGAIISQLSEEDEDLTKDALTRVLKRVRHHNRERTFCERSYESDIHRKEEIINNDSGPIKELELRPDQVLLAESAMQGQNTIIVAPTGSGKTYVAMGIIKHHFDGSPEVDEKPKVLFVAPTVPLVDQHYKEINAHFSNKKVMKISGEQTQTRLNIPLEVTFATKDILVLTPQILANALAKEEVKSIREFSLIILDECHHTGKEHPYATMMKFYLQEKKKSKHQLPQIVGLTASVGVDGANRIDKAVDNILRLCAHLDVVEISMNEEEQTNAVVEETEEVPDRGNDQFKRRVAVAMARIEHRMFSMDEFRTDEELKKFYGRFVTPPDDRASPMYDAWVSQMTIDQITHPKVRNVLVASTKHLAVYHRGLLLSRDCLMEDALEYIENELTTIGVAPDSELDDWLQSLFTDMKPELKEYSQEDHNPKLELLKKRILEQKKNNEDLRVIIFCMTRELTRAICRWMKHDPELKPIGAQFFVGRNKTAASSDRASMTQTMQEEALIKFNEGMFKILVATSVAQEGIHIKECDTVILYSYTTSEIGRIQSRGRIRALHGRYIAIGTVGRGTGQRENVNRMREHLMNEALVKIQAMSERERQERIARHQTELLVGWYRKEKVEQYKRNISRREKTGMDLLCLECNEYACTLDDIRTIKGMNYVVLDKEFDNRVMTESFRNPEQYDPDIILLKKLYCRKCEIKCDWGTQVRYKETLFNIIKIKAFVLRNPQGQTKNYKQWKKVPVKPTEITDEELDEYLDWRAGTLCDESAGISAEECEVTEMGDTLQ